jgi:FAD:protein FMN transferase
VKIWHPRATASHRACQEVFRIWQDVDETMSLYKPASDLVALNNHAGKGVMSVAPSLMEVLQEAQKYSQKTRGRYDMRVGRLMDYWGMGVETDRVHGQSTQEHTQEKIPSAPQVFLYPSLGKAALHAHTKLDLGGIAKGYALDKAAQALRQRHVERAILDLGGQLFILNPPAEGWSIGIREPGNVQRIVGTLRIKETCSIGVSSQEDHFIQRGGESLGHVMDPRDGLPVSQEGSTSVIAPTATQADALSTAFLMATPQEISALLRDFPAVEVLRVTAKENGHWQIWREKGK